MIQAAPTFMFDNLIFDWSGTLVDDLQPTLEATNHVFRRYGTATMDLQQFRHAFRLPYSEFYQEHLPDVPLEELEVHFREAFALAPTPVRVLPNTRDKLDWCRQRGIRCFVLTSMDSQEFHKQLMRLEMAAYFEQTYSGIVDKRQVIHAILTDHGLQASRTAYVGDMVHDVVTAHHGGIAGIAVLSGYSHRQVLEQAQPHWIFDDVSQMRTLWEDTQP